MKTLCFCTLGCLFWMMSSPRFVGGCDYVSLVDHGPCCVMLKCSQTVASAFTLINIFFKIFLSILGILGLDCHKICGDNCREGNCMVEEHYFFYIAAAVNVFGCEIIFLSNFSCWCRWNDWWFIMTNEWHSSQSWFLVFPPLEHNLFIMLYIHTVFVEITTTFVII